MPEMAELTVTASPAGPLRSCGSRILGAQVAQSTGCSAPALLAAPGAAGAVGALGAWGAGAAPLAGAAAERAGAPPPQPLAATTLPSASAASHSRALIGRLLLLRRSQHFPPGPERRG